MSRGRNTVIINCFETYERRAELVREYFSQKGDDVQVITSNWLHFKKEIRQSCPEGYRMIPVKPYRKNFSAERLISHHGFAKNAFEAVEEIKPDLIWILLPPNSLAKTAAKYKEKYPDVKLIFDFIDMWPETMPISKFKSLPPFSFWRNLRDNYVYAADLAVTECGLYRGLLDKKCNSDVVHTLYLAKEDAPFESTPSLPADKISLCYLGSVNNIIDIPCICNIIRAIDLPVELHIIGDGEKKDELLSSASEAGAEVIYHGRVYDREEKQRIFDRCHFGLNIMKDSVFVGLTMKSTDYWEASLPIINNIKGDTWQFVSDNPIGINYSEGMRLTADKLLPLQESRAEVRAFFETRFSKDAFMETIDGIVSYLN